MTTNISKKLWNQYRHLNLTKSNKWPILFQFCTRCHKGRLDTKEATCKIWVVVFEIWSVLLCSNKKTTWTQVKYMSNFQILQLQNSNSSVEFLHASMSKCLIMEVLHHQVIVSLFPNRNDQQKNSYIMPFETQITNVKKQGKSYTSKEFIESVVLKLNNP